MTKAHLVSMPPPDPESEPAFDFRGPWFGSREAQAYVKNKTLAAYYQWKKRHGIVTRSNGTVAKADLDRALSPKNRTPRGMVAAQLNNLRHHKAR